MRINLFIGYFMFYTLIIIFLYFYLNRLSLNDFPAPNLSNSYSFNEKMLFLREHINKTRIISIGSSTSLNNLSSESIVDNFDSRSYINTSSWGMSTKDTYNFFKYIYPLFQPKTIFIASTVQDFQREEKIIRYSILNDFLRPDHSPILTHIITFKLNYYIRNLKYAHKVRSGITEFEYLKFDNYGGVQLISDDSKYEDIRWNLHFVNDTIIQYQYDYLDSISDYCKKNKAHLIFINSPIRTELYLTLGQKDKATIDCHLSKISSIIKEDGNIFIDANNKYWNDSLFKDGVHLNSVGSKVFTDYCLEAVGDSIRANASISTN